MPLWGLGLAPGETDGDLCAAGLLSSALGISTSRELVQIPTGSPAVGWPSGGIASWAKCFSLAKGSDWEGT